MAAPQIGRNGYVALAIEAVAGTPEATPDVFFPFTDTPSHQNKHDPIEITAGSGSREIDVDSVVGKKWAEGNLPVNLDVIRFGYLAKLAMGQEIYTAGTPSDHQFYVTTSGNTPTTATLWISEPGIDVMQYAGAVVDTLEVNVEGDVGTASAAFHSLPGTVVAAPTLTTTSGTILAFHNYNAKFGATLTAAGSASATALNSLKWTINNNTKQEWASGSTSPSDTLLGGFKVSGSYVTFFRDTTDRENYRNLLKKALIVTFTGNANEELRFRAPRLRLDTWESSGGLDDLKIGTGSFTAEKDTSQVPNLFDIRLQNSKASAYT